MRRLLRYSFNSLTLLSALICLGTLVVWTWSTITEIRWSGEWRASVLNCRWRFTAYDSWFGLDVFDKDTDLSRFGWITKSLDLRFVAVWRSDYVDGRRWS